MDKIESSLQEKLAADPEQSVALIIRTDGDPTPHLPRVAELGLQVGHQFKLVPGVSVTGPAHRLQSSLSARWRIMYRGYPFGLGGEFATLFLSR